MAHIAQSKVIFVHQNRTSGIPKSQIDWFPIYHHIGRVVVKYRRNVLLSYSTEHKVCCYTKRRILKTRVHCFTFTLAYCSF